MNKTEENLKRIRAYDAEQWRTIKGAHVLVGEDGTVKAGAGGKFNGQKFGQGGGSSSGNSRILKSMGGSWSKGKINGYEVEVKHFNSGSKYGIGAGKISKLTIKKDGKTVANYDRGWDIKPQDKSASAVYKKVLEEIEGDSSGKMTAGAGMSKTQAMKNLASAANPGGSGFNYKSHPQYKQGLEHATKFWEQGPGTETDRFTSAIAEADEKLEKWNRLLKKNPDGPGSEISKRSIAWYNGAREAHIKALQKFKAKSKSDKVPVKYDSKGKAVITPDVKKAVNEEFERNKKRFPNQDEAVKQTLKKYFDKAQAYLDKDMHDEYAYENAKARCLMKKIYGKEYATKDT